MVLSNFAYYFRIYQVHVEKKMIRLIFYKVVLVVLFLSCFFIFLQVFFCCFVFSFFFQFMKGSHSKFLRRETLISGYELFMW